MCISIDWYDHQSDIGITYQDDMTYKKILRWNCSRLN